MSERKITPPESVFDVDPNEVTSEWDSLKTQPSTEPRDLEALEDLPIPGGPPPPPPNSSSFNQTAALTRYDPRSTLVLAPWLGKQLATYTAAHPDPAHPDEPLANAPHLQRAFSPLSQLNGFVAAYVGDLQTGALLIEHVDAQAEPEPLLYRAYAITLTQHIQRLQQATPQSPLQDAIFTFDQRYHLARITQRVRGHFFLLVLQKTRANLGLARLRLAELEEGLYPDAT